MLHLSIEHLHVLSRRTLIEKRRPLALAADAAFVTGGRWRIGHGHQLLLVQLALVDFAHLLVEQRQLCLALSLL